MINYDVCVCYGVMISDEIEKQLYNNWNADYYEEYVHSINTWTDDEGYFFGLTKSIPLTTSLNVLNDIDISKYEKDRFDNFVNKERLKNLVNWNPKYYIINFCY